jgi:hypothetical protein
VKLQEIELLDESVIEYPTNVVPKGKVDEGASPVLTAGTNPSQLSHVVGSVQEAV